jgi:hypothetical protein
MLIRISRKTIHKGAMLIHIAGMLIHIGVMLIHKESMLIYIGGMLTRKGGMSISKGAMLIHIGGMLLKKRCSIDRVKSFDAKTDQEDLGYKDRMIQFKFKKRMNIFILVGV